MNRMTAVVIAVLLVGRGSLGPVACDGAGEDRSAARPLVGLVACDDVFYPNASLAFTHQDTRALLESCGFSVHAMGCQELADARILDPAEIRVLLNIYGDAFPGEAAATLRAFHRRGGCLLSNGVPFGFPCRREGDEWEGAFPPEQECPRLHAGIGTGGTSSSLPSRTDASLKR